MAEEINANETNKQIQRGLSLPEFNNQNRNTIYKLTLSIKRRFNPQQGTSEAASPVEAREVRDLLHRLVEIDDESRVLLSKVFALLEKDETLEDYVKKRIEDPKVSKMWQLVEQVLAFQEGELKYSDMILDDDDDDDDYMNNYVINEKGLKEKDEPEKEKKNERFKVKDIGSGTGVQAGATSSGSTSGVGSTKSAGSSSSSNKTGVAK